MKLNISHEDLLRVIGKLAKDVDAAIVMTLGEAAANTSHKAVSDAFFEAGLYAGQCAVATEEP